MNYFAPNNIYLCDLKYLNAEIEELESRGAEKEFLVTFLGRKPLRLLARPCPQGWHVTKGLDVNLSDLADYMAKQFEPRDRMRYFCFTKIRESKMRAIKALRLMVAMIGAYFAWKFLDTGRIFDAVPVALAVMMEFVSLFLPREALKTTFQDYMRYIENGGDDPLDYYDKFDR